MKNLFIEPKFINFNYKNFKIITTEKNKKSIINLIDNFNKKERAFYGRGEVYRFSNFIIREYKHGGIFRNILKNKFFSENRFLTEFKIYSYLQKYNFPTIEAVGVLITYQGFFKNGLIITKELKEVLELSKFQENSEVYFSTGKIIRQLHEHYIIHGDLHLKNILIHKKNFTPYIIDFDKSFFSEIDKLKQRDIKRFLRSVKKFNYFHENKIKEKCIKAFLTGYGEKIHFSESIINKISWYFNKPNF